MTPGAGSAPLPIDPPALMPVQDDQPDFMTVASMSFGWSKSKFEVSKFKWSGGRSTLARWPVSDDGWKQAWDFMRVQHPDLAGAVLRACTGRVDQQEAEGDRAGLESEHPFRALRSWILGGGEGWDTGLSTGDPVDLYFTEQGVTLTRAGAYRAYLKRDYASVNALDIRPGQPGDGPSGAMKFLAPEIAERQQVNALAAASRQAVVLLKCADAAVMLLTDKATPNQTELYLAPVQPRIGRAAPTAVADRLIRLGDMLDKGQLTPDEFTAAKAGLLG